MNDRIIPIIALDAKNKANNNPNESNPIRGDLKKVVSINEMMVSLYPVAGIIFLISNFNCVSNSSRLIKGKLGSNVNKNKKDGGIAMMKL
ncbi:MAG: hypothetical protein WDM71_06255 [Ferruginibacter sp.]